MAGGYELSIPKFAKQQTGRAAELFERDPLVHKIKTNFDKLAGEQWYKEDECGDFEQLCI